MRYSRVCLPAQLGEPGFETAACGVLQGLGSWVHSKLCLHSFGPPCSGIVMHSKVCTAV